MLCVYIYILHIYIIYIYIYICDVCICVTMKTICYHPGYHHNGFNSLYQTLIKIKHNKEMAGKICPNMKLTPPCTPFPQHN